MTDAGHVPPRSNGCLRGCLVVIAVILLPFVLAAGYGAWFLYQGFRQDPVLHVVTVLLDRDGLARQVLGGHIRITGVEGNAFSFVPGLGSHTDYEVTLSGDRASGRLEVEADTSHGHVDFKSMILTGPHGGRYDLLHNSVLDQPRGDTESI